MNKEENDYLSQKLTKAMNRIQELKGELSRVTKRHWQQKGGPDQTSTQSTTGAELERSNEKH